MQVVDEKQTEEKVKKTPKELTMFILTIVGNVVFYAVIIMLFLFSIMNINAGNDGKGFPNLFGNGFLSVQSDSMNGESTEYDIDSFNKGDLVKVKVFKDKDCSNLEIGDVITFYDPTLEALNTHRVVYIHDDYSYVICQGDKIVKDVPSYKYDVNMEVSLKYILESQGHTQNVSVENIKGVVTGVSEGAGTTLDNIQKNWLFIFVIPVLVFLLIEIFLVIKNIMDLKGAKQKAEMASDKDAMMAELEAQKEAMRQQILAELAAQQAQATPEVVVADAAIETPAEETVEVVEEVPTEVATEEVVEENKPEEDKE